MVSAATSGKMREALRWALVVVYAGAGLLHLKSPHAFEQIVPPWVPQPHLVVLATGVAELVGAAGLIIGRLRWMAGVGLAAYAVCVWPANFHHAIAHVAIGGVTLGWAYHGPRLLFQPVLIWAALFAGKVIDWPLSRRKG